MVARQIRLANQAAVGPAEALRAPNVGELVNAAVSGLGEHWIAALVRFRVHAAVGRRVHPPERGFVAFPQGGMDRRSGGTRPSQPKRPKAYRKRSQ